MNIDDDGCASSSFAAAASRGAAASSSPFGFRAAASSFGSSISSPASASAMSNLSLFATQYLVAVWKNHARQTPGKKMKNAATRSKTTAVPTTNPKTIGAEPPHF